MNEVLYANYECGMFYRAWYKGDGTMLGMVGKKVEMETIELDHMLIGGKYYEIVGYLGHLAMVKEVM